MTEATAGTAPGYWLAETTGILRPVVMAYLEGKDMVPEQVATMRAYLRQWIADPSWQGPGIAALRERVEAIRTREDVENWLADADEAGVDPL